MPEHLKCSVVILIIILVNFARAPYHHYHHHTRAHAFANDINWRSMFTDRTLAIPSLLSHNKIGMSHACDSGSVGIADHSIFSLFLFWYQ